MSVFNKVLLSPARARLRRWHCRAAHKPAHTRPPWFRRPSPFVRTARHRPDDPFQHRRPASMHSRRATKSLQHYGFPPRPDRAKDQHAFAFWSKLVTAPVKRVVPKQQATTIYQRSGDHQFDQPDPAAQLSRPPGPPAATGAAMSMSRRPANIRSAPTTPMCTASSWFRWHNRRSAPAPAAMTIRRSGSASTAGTAPDVFQAGIEADAYCSGSDHERRTIPPGTNGILTTKCAISSPAVAPGDLIEVYVWNSSRTVGNYYMVNYTQNDGLVAAVHRAERHAAARQFCRMDCGASGCERRAGHADQLCRDTVVSRLGVHSVRITTISPTLPTGTTAYSITMTGQQQQLYQLLRRQHRTAR